MWWCCGRTGKDDPGCRFGKHESKDDDEKVNGFEDEKANDRKKRLDQIRCYVRFDS